MEKSYAPLSNLALLHTGVQSQRWSSYDRQGGNADWWPIPARETITLGERQGPGCIRHIWMTTTEDDHNLRRLILRMYWDGEETPSVICPLGDFFGLGHAKATYFCSLPIQAFYLGLNCWFPMPFDSGARVTITNDSDKDSFLYFYIDYHAWNAPAEQKQGRFHAHWRREIVKGRKVPSGVNSLGKLEPLHPSSYDNYVVLSVRGKGHYVGCTLHLDLNQPGWWGEGDDMFVIDGEKWPPRLHGTGTEDYFCGAWNYNRLAQTFNTPYFGYHFKGNADYTGKHSQYRFHVEDPIIFERSLTFSIEHGHANTKAGEWTSTAYWYQVDRQDPLPEMPGFEDRIPFAHGGIENWPGRDREDLPR